MRPVHVARYDAPYRLEVPHRLALRGGHTRGVEAALYGVEPEALGRHAEDLIHDAHLWLVDDQGVFRLVVPEAVPGLPRDIRVALSDPAEHAPPRPLGNLGPLVLGELVEDAVRELTLGCLVTPVVEGLQSASVLLELLL